MQTISVEEFKKRYGTQGVATMSGQAQQPGFFDRVKQTIQNSANQVNNAIGGQGEYEGKSILNRATGAVASAFNAIPGVVTDALPSPIRKGIGGIEKFAGETINNVVNNAGKNPFSFGKADNNALIDTPQYQNFANSKLGQKTADVAGTLSNTGQIAGNILTIDQGIKEGTKAGQTIGQKSDQVLQNVKTEAQNLTQKVKEIPNNIRTNNNPDTFIKSLVSPEIKGTEAIKAVKTGKVAEAQGMGQRDFSGAINNLDDLSNAVKNVPGISSTKTNLQNLNAIHDEVGNLANTLEQQVAKEKSFFSPNQFKGLMNKVKITLGEDPTLVGDAATSATKVMTKFERLVAEQGYTSKGLLKARKLLDDWIRSQKGTKIFNPATESGISGAIREIRQTGNDFLAGISPNSQVKALLKTQTDLYRAIDNIAPKAVKEGSSILEQMIKAHPVVSKVIKTAGRAAGLGIGVKMGEDFIP